MSAHPPSAQVLIDADMPAPQRRLPTVACPGRSPLGNGCSHRLSASSKLASSIPSPTTSSKPLQAPLSSVSPISTGNPHRAATECRYKTGEATTSGFHQGGSARGDQGRSCGRTTSHPVSGGCDQLGQIRRGHRHGEPYLAALESLHPGLPGDSGVAATTLHYRGGRDHTTFTGPFPMGCREISQSHLQRTFRTHGVKKSTQSDLSRTFRTHGVTKIGEATKRV